MYNQNALKFSANLIEIRQALAALKEDGFEDSELNQATKNLLKAAAEITNFQASALSDTESAFSLGVCEPQKTEIGLDISKSFSVFISAETEADRAQAKSLIFSLMSKIASKPTNYWRCVSPRDGSISFGKLNSVINSDLARFGGKIFSDEIEINNMLSQTEKLLNKNIADSGAEDIFRYNAENSEQLPVVTLVVFDISGLSEISFRKLKSLCNMRKAGLNMIVLNQNRSSSRMLSCDLNMSFNKGFYFEVNDTVIPAEQTQHTISARDLETLQQKPVVSSRFEDIFGDEIVPFTKYAKDCIEIPFALENGKICSFEIGGKSAAHALISGRTGSGKSVTLHTIIDLVTLFYRPDDVEIWTIDYKAVEFKCYADKRTPHICVIGQDNSIEFSISLIKLLKKEFDRRKKLFSEASVNDLEGYRKKHGDYSIARLLIVIDEFHNLVQALQNYQDNIYKTVLENLLKEARSMGMSFVFCSQSVVSGLTGLTDSGKNQIGLRICMKQDAATEITETLRIKATDTQMIEEAKNFDKGFAFYNDGESGVNGIKKVKVIFISDEMRMRIINCVNAQCSEKDWGKDEIIFKDSERYLITEKRKHKFNLMISGKIDAIASPEKTTVYPAAPVSLENEFGIDLTRNSANNILIAGSDDDMRESLAFHSICSILSNPCNSVKVNIPDPNNIKSASLLNCLKQLNCDRLTYNLGVDAVINEIKEASLLKSDPNKSKFFIWFQLNKLRPAMVAMEANNSSASETSSPNTSGDILNSLDEAINMVKASRLTPSEPQPAQNQTKKVTFESVAEQLKQLFEYGPDQGCFNVVIYQTAKNFEKDKFLRVTDFDFRFGTHMSADDSYLMFGKEGFVKCTDETTAVCYKGDKTPVPIRPYLMPDSRWINDVNNYFERSRVDNA